MFKELSFAAFTSVINKVIQSDPFALDYLQSLRHKSLRLIILKTPLDLWIQFHSNMIEIKPFEAQDKATITLTGTPSGLLRFTKSHEHTRLLMEKNVKIDGELEVLLDIKKFQEQLEIDWEALLAERIGDFAANRMVTMGKSIRDKLRYQLQRSKQHVDDYLRYESRLLVRREELDKFSHGILSLRRELDRADARLKLIEKH